MALLTWAVAVLVLCCTVAEDAVSYRGHRVLRVPVPTQRDRHALENVLRQEEQVRQLAMVKGRHQDLLAAPGVWERLEARLRDAGLNHSTVTEDLGELIDKENPLLPDDYSEEADHRTGHRLTWERYHSLEDIDSYLEYLSSVYSNICSTEVIGYSSEGRPLKLLKVSTGGTPKPSIWIDAGAHGREWIAPATATFLLLQLIERGESPDLLAAFDWLVLPVANPDGYEYSRSRDRLWRKTRSPPPSGSRSRCAGVDLNRNWDFHWAPGGRGGARCREDYAGPAAFSEPETKAAADRMLALNGTLQLYLSLHAYSQMWLLPWGYQDEKPSDYYELFVMAEEATQALYKERGTEYLVGTTPDLVYRTAGSSDDWAKGVAGAQYSYTVELPDTGTYGFALPAHQIRPVGTETWSAIQAVARRLAHMEKS